MWTKRFHSLRTKNLLVLLLGVGIALVLFFTAQFTFRLGIEEIYLSRGFSDWRYARALHSLSAYVEENEVASTDIKALRGWCSRNWHLLLFQADQIVFASDEGDSEGVALEAGARLAPITFSDGEYRVLLLDYSQDWLLAIGTVVSLALAVFGLLVTLFSFTGRIGTRLLRLSSEVASLGNGNLQQQITVRGSDELAQLEQNVELMRRSLIEKMENEAQAWQSNRDLITSLSHDLRTPLTAMLGYLELIRENGEENAQIRQYTDACMNRALQLKQMSDEMFRYFLVYDRAEQEIRPEEFDAFDLLGQMIGEQVLLAEEQGFRFRLSIPEKLGKIQVDTQYLQRLFDNLFSNISKYAEPKKEIQIQALRVQKTVQIRLQNAIRPLEEKPESSGIGLATCRRIMLAMHGEMETQTQRGVFLTRLVFPSEEE